jgi:hypothetical protein
VDNDGDGDTDCADSDCSADPLCVTCPNQDLGFALGDAVATGTNTGFGDDFPTTTGCGSNNSSGEDVAFAWTSSASGCYEFDTETSNFDTVLRIFDGCAGALLDCDDDMGAGTTSRLRMELGPGTPLIVVVDGHDAASAGNYVLDINYIGAGCP